MSNATRNHLFIAGTGRTGTSFLVQYLTHLGLETHLSKNQNAYWDEDANAGLEDIPIYTYNKDLPYVIKTPWLFQFVDQILSDETIKIDSIIIPVRNLVEAATSRTILEMKVMYKNFHWMQDLNDNWEAIGYTPGGMVFSLNPLDQARLLAVSFHELIHKLVRADIPIILLEFPKLVNDSGYLFNKLKHLLPTTINLGKAIKIHNNLVDNSKVRVNQEINTQIQPHKIYETPSIEKVANIALKRELKQIHVKLDHANQMIQLQHNSILENQQLQEKINTLTHQNEKLLLSNHQLSKKLELFQQHIIFVVLNKKFMMPIKYIYHALKKIINVIQGVGQKKAAQ